MTPQPEVVSRWIDVLKNLLLIIVGVFIIIHETIGTQPPSIVLLVTAAAALGLPVIDYLTGAVAGRNGQWKEKP